MSDCLSSRRVNAAYALSPGAGTTQYGYIISQPFRFVNRIGCIHTNLTFLRTHESEPIYAFSDAFAASRQLFSDFDPVTAETTALYVPFLRFFDDAPNIDRKSVV